MAINTDTSDSRTYDFDVLAGHTRKTSPVAGGNWVTPVTTHSGGSRGICYLHYNTDFRGTYDYKYKLTSSGSFSIFAAGDDVMQPQGFIIHRLNTSSLGSSVAYDGQILRNSDPETKTITQFTA